MVYDDDDYDVDDDIEDDVDDDVGVAASNPEAKVSSLSILMMELVMSSQMQVTMIIFFQYLS